MRFGPLSLDEAEGAILAHSLSAGGLRLKKGHRLGAGDLARLAEAGLRNVVAARLEAGDVPEDRAADLVAAAAAGPGTRRNAPFTGRANLYAEAHGIALLDATRVDRLNLVHEALTIATVAPFETVEPGQMLATVKVIPFAAPEKAVAECSAIAREGGPLVAVAAFRPHRVGLLVTRLPQTRDSVVEKTAGSVRQRVEELGSQLAAVKITGHETEAVGRALGALAREDCEPLLVFGASAIVDRRDVIPAGIEVAGGEVEHFGMPVDPGNLLLIGRIGGRRVIGVPGCARSPKLNGFDWVLQRMLAGIAVGRTDIQRMGVGGLLKEIATRPQPREQGGETVAPRAPRIAAIVLAAGQSRRMGTNKLLEQLDGQPMIRRVVDAVLQSQARPVVVVTGNQADEVRTLLRGRPVALIHNQDFAQGLSSSLRRGLSAIPSDCDGVMICLGDMPRVSARHIDRLIAAFNPTEGRAICVPTWNGKRGNPVLFAAMFLPEMREVAGDTGARHLIGRHGELVCEVAMDDNGVLLDVDTPEALASLRAAGGTA
ncbi:MAG: molybdopterin-binding/glycosyltransferase family 2 protein [Alphaproteobacteria bacterium]|nr:molybdopterin-binding/glycosyltransferase family 2 protein [Alphaproteobacteria bacterium]